MWQRAIVDFGVSGPDGVNGRTYLILAPGMEAPEGVDDDKYTVVRNPTNIVFLEIRALQADLAEADKMLRQFQIYPYSERNKKPKTTLIEAGDTPWGGWQPHGMSYWHELKEIIDREAVTERDRLMLSMLDTLGLRKGQPFEPNERQKALLKEGAVVGEAMVKGITTRTPIVNSEDRAAVSSRTRVVENDDGSVTIHFSPALPKGVNEENWLQTNLGNCSFAKSGRSGSAF